jgi:hypothetical protein
MAAGLAALAPIFAFRWTQASNLALIYSIEISAGANVAATAAANCAFSAVVARTWSVVDTGGTAVTPATNDCKLRASMGASLVNDVRISTTATLTAGTRTLDGQNLGQVAFGVGTGAITTAENLTLVPLTQLFGAKKSGMPLVLTTNEGFIIRTGNVAFPATMTWHFGVNVHWAEVAAF